MPHLDGLTGLGVDLNPPHLGDWPYRLGQFIINFGGIELLSYQYLDSLEDTRAAFDKNLDRFLSPRIDRILELIDASTKFSDADKADFKSLWGAAKELAIWRNRIVHNPVLPTWKPGSGSSPDRDPPDVMGIPDMKQLKGGGGVSDSLSMEAMIKMVEGSFDLAQRLHAAVRKVQS
jgi:hypothetical protein